MMGTCVYIAGPMTDIPLYNFPAFFKAEELLKQRGWTVLNPARHDQDVLGFDPANDTLQDIELRDVFAWDTKVICEQADTLAMLPGWEKSHGAQIEYHLARKLGHDIYAYTEVLSGEFWWDRIHEDYNPLAPPPVQHDGDPRFHALLAEIGELHDRKQRDYGTDSDPFANVRASAELGIEPWRGVVNRMGDKWSRIKQFCKRGTLANEGFEDSLLDIAVYALIGLILYREAKE